MASVAMQYLGSGLNRLPQVWPLHVLITANVLSNLYMAIDRMIADGFADLQHVHTHCCCRDCGDHGRPWLVNSAMDHLHPLSGPVAIYIDDH